MTRMASTGNGSPDPRSGPAPTATSRQVVDVVVVGASVAGTTVATLLGRAGLRVALVEKHRSIDTHKVLCTHTIHAAAGPTIRRLGLDDRIEAAGGIRTRYVGWTRWGWIDPQDDHPPSYNLRRKKLDPLLRRLAADTPGVELMTGRRVVGLLESDGAVSGVRVRTHGGGQEDVRARLVVGADGAHSTVAKLVDAPERVRRNARSFFFAYYADADLPASSRSRFWIRDPDVAYAFPNDDGLTLLAYFPAKGSLPDFQRDREGTLLSRLRSVPDGPALDRAQRESPVIVATDFPIVKRPPVPCRGVALVGDAALTSDPTFGVGCEWAFRSAEWLADAVAPALAVHKPLGPALRAYRRCRRALRGHQFYIEMNARAPTLTPMDGLIMSAAARDPGAAADMIAFFDGRLPLRRFVGPRALARAVRVTARHRWSAAPDTTTSADRTPDRMTDPSTVRSRRR